MSWAVILTHTHNNRHTAGDWNLIINKEYRPWQEVAAPVLCQCSMNDETPPHFTAALSLNSAVVLCGRTDSLRGASRPSREMFCHLDPIPLTFLQSTAANRLQSLTASTNTPPHVAALRSARDSHKLKQNPRDFENTSTLTCDAQWEEKDTETGNCACKLFWFELYNNIIQLRKLWVGGKVICPLTKGLVVRSLSFLFSLNCPWRLCWQCMINVW